MDRMMRISTDCTTTEFASSLPSPPTLPLSWLAKFRILRESRRIAREIRKFHEPHVKLVIEYGVSIKRSGFGGRWMAINTNVYPEEIEYGNKLLERYFTKKGLKVGDTLFNWVGMSSAGGGTYQMIKLYTTIS